MSDCVVIAPIWVILGCSWQMFASILGKCLLAFKLQCEDKTFYTFLGVVYISGFLES